ncbi:MAG: hypothetical protein MH825_05705 [Cyanobacteria bacterium]|nr:hypothetical protein [Cyanobacteriota bacterium]
MGTDWQEILASPWVQHGLGLGISIYLVGVAVDYMGRFERAIASPDPVDPSNSTGSRSLWGAVRLVFVQIPPSLLWFWRSRSRG